MLVIFENSNLKIKIINKLKRNFEKGGRYFRKLERESQLGSFEKDKKQTKSQLVD